MLTSKLSSGSSRASIASQTIFWALCRLDQGWQGCVDRCEPLKYSRGHSDLCRSPLQVHFNRLRKELHATYPGVPVLDGTQRARWKAVFAPTPQLREAGLGIDHLNACWQLCSAAQTCKLLLAPRETKERAEGCTFLFMVCSTAQLIASLDTGNSDLPLLLQWANF